MSEVAAEDFETGAPAPPKPGESSHVAATDRAPDYERREFALRERLDEPCPYAAYRTAMMDLAQVNRWTRGYAPVLEFLERVVQRTGVRQEPLHVVDVGCGSGDGLRTIARWARKRSVPLKLTGVDINRYAARLARELDRAEGVAAKTISWVTADLFDVELKGVDVVVSSLLAHHLSDTDVVRFLQWIEATAKVGWQVNDLRRSERAAKIFGMMARVVGWDRMVEEDGLVSFRRAFSLHEWRVLVDEVGGAEVKDLGLGRLSVERLR